MRLLALLLSGIAIAACGGGGNDGEPPNDLDKGKISAALGRIQSYCGSGSASSADNDQLHTDVGTLIDQYEDSPDDEFQLQPGAEPTTMRQVLETTRGIVGAQASGLATTTCSEAEAKRIGDALG